MFRITTVDGRHVDIRTNLVAAIVDGGLTGVVLHMAGGTSWVVSRKDFNEKYYFKLGVDKR